MINKKLNDFVKRANSMPGKGVHVKKAFTDGKNYILVMYNEASIGTVCIFCDTESGTMTGISPIDPRFDTFKKSISI